LPALPVLVARCMVVVTVCCCDGICLYIWLRLIDSGCVL